LHELLAPMPLFAAVLIAAGCSLYLLGGALFRWALGYASPGPRLGGAIASGVVILPGLYASPAAALASIAIVIFATMGVERRFD